MPENEVEISIMKQKVKVRCVQNNEICMSQE